MGQEIDTGELTAILRQTADVQAWPGPWLPADSFAAYYDEMLKTHGRRRAAAIANSGLEMHYAYQIMAGRKKASRDKLICLCIGAGMTVKQTDRALQRGMVSPLYPKRKRDAIIMKALDGGIDAVWKVNTLLANQGEDLLQ